MNPRRRRICFALLLLIWQLPLAIASADWRYSGDIAAELRIFADDGVDPAQHGDSLALALEPEWYLEWNQGQDAFTLVPFIRWDQNDDERTHFDLREAIWLRAGSNWEVRAGIGKVFWGVTESQHLVDIINQTDQVENPDGEDKLGQPMINLSLIRNWGTLDLFVLPGFRERTFPGNDGRLRFQPRVDTSRAIYESGAEQGHIDLAARWSHAVGDWDLGLSHFHGTSRDPRFELDRGDSSDPVLVPVYEQIDQTGVDVQLTRGSWLWKLEAIRRAGQGPTFYAATGGFEYSFYGLFGSPLDLGAVVEYLYNDHADSTRSPFADDLFVGLRVAFNDSQSTELLIGCIMDADSDARFCSLEASRRIRDHWVLTVEARAFSAIPVTDPLFSLRQDDYLQLELAYHF